MFTQLNPTIPVHVLGKGDGYAIGVIDYGQEHNLIWVTAIDETGELWCAPNHKVRLGKNWTMGRGENPLITKDKADAHSADKPFTAAIVTDPATQNCCADSGKLASA